MLHDRIEEDFEDQFGRIHLTNLKIIDWVLASSKRVIFVD
jgi:hypothetical protein